MANGFDPRVTAAPRAPTVGRDSVAVDAGLRSYMLSVYNYMTSGVLLTGIVALLFANSEFGRNILINGGRSAI
jgi:FtsH-binding integral membrane protein